MGPPQQSQGQLTKETTMPYVDVDSTPFQDYESMVEAGQELRRDGNAYYNRLTRAVLENAFSVSAFEEGFRFQVEDALSCLEQGAIRLFSRERDQLESSRRCLSAHLTQRVKAGHEVDTRVFVALQESFGMLEVLDERAYAVLVG